MNLPKIAATCPSQVELEPGKKYAWCSCGLSDSQPFCDGSHRGTDFTPELIQADDNKTVYFCQCKQTGNSPYCDGTHNQLDPDS